MQRIPPNRLTGLLLLGFVVFTLACACPVAAQDKALQKKIDQAISKGVDYLISQQQIDGSFTSAQGGFPTGMTALALYAMIKSGLPKTHHAILRSAIYIRTNPPIKTYSCACQLMALVALNNPKDIGIIQERADLLMSWQRGTYGYPANTPDLSNTQYAALGLRAAAKRGITIPAKVWLDLGEATLNHKVGGKKGYGAVGFSYRPKGGATGSMTTAGIAVLAICEEQLQKKGRRVVSFQRAREGGVEWMTKNFSVDDNPPGKKNNWRLHYYLYGLERVGDLLRIKTFGKHDWYTLGAKKWIKTQGGKGDWSAWGNYKQEDTAFGVLFLARATSGTSGNSPLTTRKYGEIKKDHSFSLRASGDTPMTIWLAAFGNPVLGDIWPDDNAANGPRIAGVTYFEPKAASLTSKAATGTGWRYIEGKIARGFEMISMIDNHWAEGEMPFGHPATPITPYQTSWESHQLTLRKSFNWDPTTNPHPKLHVQNTRGDVRSTDRPPTDKHVWLFNENTDFAAHLDTHQNGSKCVITDEDAASGKLSLKLTAKQSYSIAIPGWGFRITKNPKKGEYRYLRFAWKKTDGEQLMAQFVNRGGWGLRYFAGTNALNWKPSFKLQESGLPEKWTEVTRDLYADYGNKDAVISGLAFATVGGKCAYLDSIQLGRRKSDLKSLKKTPKNQKKTSSGDLKIWVNEKLLWSSSKSLNTLQTVEPLLPLTDVLQPGKNLLVVQAPNTGPHQVVAADIVTDRIIARLTEDKPRPMAGRRFPVKHSFSGLGSRTVAASVDLALPNGSTKPITVPELGVEITDAIDAEALSYATDRSRNLLRDKECTITSSSVLQKRWATRAFDGFQGTDWLPSDTDPNPSISIRIMKPIRGNMIRISHANMRHIDRQRTAKIRRIRVRVNGNRQGIEVTMKPDIMRKTIIRLPRAMVISRIQLTILETNPGHAWKPAAGIGEIEVIHDRS